MIIYQHRQTVVASSGSTSSLTLKIVGGLCRQLLVTSNTATTVFKVNITDDNDLKIMDYGYYTGTLNDQTLYTPMAGKYSINITNASPDDTFKVYVAVEE